MRRAQDTPHKGPVMRSFYVLFVVSLNKVIIGTNNRIADDLRYHDFHVTLLYMDQFVYAPSQWETTLYCNVVSHWLGAYTKWSQTLMLTWKHLSYRRWWRETGYFGCSWCVCWRWRAYWSTAWCWRRAGTQTSWYHTSRSAPTTLWKIAFSSRRLSTFHGPISQYQSEGVRGKSQLA